MIRIRRSATRVLIVACLSSTTAHTLWCADEAMPQNSPKAEVSDLVDEISSKAQADGIGTLDQVKEKEDEQRSARLSEEKRRNEALRQKSKELSEKTKQELKILESQIQATKNNEASESADTAAIKEQIDASFAAQIESERKRRQEMSELDKIEEERLKSNNESMEAQNKLMEELLAALRQTTIDMKYRQLKVERIGRDIIDKTDKHAQSLELEKDLTMQLQSKIELNREFRLKTLEASNKKELLIREELFTMLRNLVREVPAFAQSLEQTVKDVSEFERVVGEEFSTVKKKYQLSTSEMSALVQDMAGQLQRMFGMIRASRDAIAQQQMMQEFENRTGKKWFERDDLLKYYRRIEEIVADRETKLNETLGSFRNEMRAALTETRQYRDSQYSENERLKNENLKLKQKLGFAERTETTNLLPAYERRDSWSSISTLKNRVENVGSQKVDVLLYDDFTNERAPEIEFEGLQIMDFTEDEI